MQEIGYVAKHKPEWDELEALVRRGRKSFRRLSADDVNRLDLLYRRASSHLAQVSTRTRDLELIRYLNDLVASAHSLIYLPPRRTGLSPIVYWITEGFARSVARTWRFHLLSAFLMIGGGFLGYFAVAGDSTAAYALMPAGEFRQPGATQEQLLYVLRSGREQGDGSKFAFAAMLLSHNFKVAITALATGILAGIPTALIMIYNGMFLGSFVHVHHSKGIYGELWAWLLPHGVSELWAIILCGGVGLFIGRAVIAPGLRTRGESLRLAARDAVAISLGAGIMLMLAAWAESFIRQSDLSQSARFLFAGLTFVFWSCYFGWGVAREKTRPGG